MNISGEEAARFDAVRLDSGNTVNRGELVEADEQTGVVSWKDHVTGETKSVTVDSCAIKIVRKSAYKR
jgi:hypothetical protein